ncbi:hypothetical protein RDI58_004454 [Solanum bulbocastanum]|uniref:Uncharacterized protein n=1 Tax=Solanum bulbocastanum TaxID=147425 RepID=A0AAN8YPZ7_SOLBU
MMDDFLSILIKHGGRSNPLGKYIDFQMEGIIYESSSLYSGLISANTSQLKIDININDVEIKYIVVIDVHLIL